MLAATTRARTAQAADHPATPMHTHRLIDRLRIRTDPRMDKQQPFHERRSGKDRRQTEAGPPGKHERRRSIEHRQPEVRELHLSREELEALGFVVGVQAAPSPQQRTA